MAFPVGCGLPATGMIFSTPSPRAVTVMARGVAFAASGSLPVPHVSLPRWRGSRRSTSTQYDFSPGLPFQYVVRGVACASTGLPGAALVASTSIALDMGCPAYSLLAVMPTGAGAVGTDPANTPL